MADKVTKSWIKVTSTAMIDFCDIVKGQLTERFEKINDNESGTEIVDASLPNAKAIIHDLGSNADIILNNAYDEAGKNPPSPTSSKI